jgi:hypothetical protein
MGRLEFVESAFYASLGDHWLLVLLIPTIVHFSRDRTLSGTSKKHSNYRTASNTCLSMVQDGPVSSPASAGESDASAPTPPLANGHAPGEKVEKTSADYYFDSYSHFGESSLVSQRVVGCFSDDCLASQGWQSLELEPVFAAVNK